MTRFAFLAPLFFLACGGAPPEPAATSTPAASASAAPAAVPATWSNDMPKEQQMAFMKQKVIPAMTPVFQPHDANFGCTSCHGPKYENPHDFLPHLTMKGGQLTAFTEKPDVAKFMASTVVPKMAGAMGLPPYDMKTNQGFGCGGCHKIDVQ